MRWSSVGLGLVLCTVFWISGCGGDGPSLPDPGPNVALDGSAQLSGLTSTDDSTFCEWFAGRLGGWGRRRDCGAAYVASPASEATCVSNFQMVPSTCPITVGDFQDCVNAVIAGPCVSGATPAACATLLSYASECP